MLCAFLFFINHPMVKVKGFRTVLRKRVNNCFNHPMVKVKVRNIPVKYASQFSFNHPMVKVKAIGGLPTPGNSMVSTTLW